MSENAQSQDDAVAELVYEVEKLENWPVVHAFKKMQVKHIRESSVNLMKVCIVLQAYGCPLTTHLIGKILEKQRRSTKALPSKLHGLGDKHCLVMKRGTKPSQGSHFEWLIDSLFLEAYR